jgi:hypothetical protein
MHSVASITSTTFMPRNLVNAFAGSTQMNTHSLNSMSSFSSSSALHPKNLNLVSDNSQFNDQQSNAVNSLFTNTPESLAKGSNLLVSNHSKSPTSLDETRLGSRQSTSFQTTHINGVSALSSLRSSNYQMAQPTTQISGLSSLSNIRSFNSQIAPPNIQIGNSALSNLSSFNSQVIQSSQLNGLSALASLLSDHVQPSKLTTNFVNLPVTTISEINIPKTLPFKHISNSQIYHGSKLVDNYPNSFIDHKLTLLEAAADFATPVQKSIAPKMHKVKHQTPAVKPKVKSEDKIEKLSESLTNINIKPKKMKGKVIDIAQELKKRRDVKLKLNLVVAGHVGLLFLKCRCWKVNNDGTFISIIRPCFRTRHK